MPELYCSLLGLRLIGGHLTMKSNFAIRTGHTIRIWNESTHAICQAEPEWTETPKPVSKFMFYNYAPHYKINRNQHKFEISNTNLQCMHYTRYIKKKLFWGALFAYKNKRSFVSKLYNIYIAFLLLGPQKAITMFSLGNEIYTVIKFRRITFFSPPWFLAILLNYKGFNQIKR